MDERKQYIELETIKRHIRRLIQDPWNHQAAPASWADAYRQMIDILDDEPAADVRPVKRGEWIDETYEVASHTGGVAVVHTGRVCCSECDEYEDYRRPFCPNCGADMRPEEERK